MRPHRIPQSMLLTTRIEMRSGAFERRPFALRHLVDVNCVLTAFFADRDREAGERFFAALRACRESARCEAALLPSRFRAREVARERFADFFVPFFLPFWTSRAACLRVFFDPFLGGGKSTPARRAFDKPMAIACLVDRAPCFPSRTCSISSRTNSPA